MMPMMVMMPIIAQLTTPIISKYGEPTRFTNPMQAVMVVMGVADQDEALKAGVSHLQKLQMDITMGKMPSDEETALIKAMVESL
jgi:hypothetical protein